MRKVNDAAGSCGGNGGHRIFPIAAEHHALAAQQPGHDRSGEDGGSGAPPSNTAPANSIGHVNILRYGIDSLYLSYPGSIFDAVDIDLKIRKRLAQSESLLDQAEAVYFLPGHNFEVGGRGGRFPYVLTDNSFRVAVSGSKAVQMPLAHVQVKSQWLTAHGALRVVEQLDDIISALGECTGGAKVGRADLFVDFTTSISLDELHRRQWVTRAKRISSHAIDGVASGYSLGLGGDISARLYDKTLQIKSSGQDYLLPLWRAAGWDGIQAVWRLEFQFERRILGEHAIEAVDSLLSHLGPIWLYAMTSWLRLTEPTPDKTRCRWPTHPVWDALSGVPWTGYEDGASVPVRAERLPSEHKLFVNGLGGLTSFMGRHHR